MLKWKHWDLVSESWKKMSWINITMGELKPNTDKRLRLKIIVRDKIKEIEEWNYWKWEE